ncbi:hypothetical protein ASD67_07810 [Sphingopyxis sp. Root1497]|uniref:TIGR04222 domain-containing membrane protein n=1 Tax=Sphingopyxis sp. Root1497 TaxID=1736474 RepID=UPI0006F1DE67|nr:TIGR04222 domain-containing membrane protein [Sphingopyxis sp. Root1497]KQZ64380.1 hypothetical protein ASD67_07810 [Sphingopyxis sp. Root1497]
MNPLDWDPLAFIGIYFLLLMIVGPVAWLLPRLLRPAGRVQRLHDPDSLAYLAGRGARFADTVATRAVASGAIAVEGKIFRTADGAASSGAERAILALRSPFGWDHIVAALQPETVALRRRLESAGLLLDPDEHRRLRLLAIAPYAVLLLFGAIRLLADIARGGPLFVLSLLMLLTLIPLAIRWRFVSDQTRAGRAAVKDARRAHQRLRRAPTRRESDLAVALFGTGVLAGSELAAFYQLRNPHNSPEGSNSSGSCGSSCGGDSGCGSGCGGGGD